MNGYRKRYDTEYARIMPHITIKSHFEINDDELDSVKEEVKKIEGFGPEMFMLQKLQVLNQLTM